MNVGGRHDTGGTGPFLHADAVSWRYPGGPWVFQDLSVRLAGGQLLRVRGGNGSGKSSLLRVVAGCAVARRGTVTLSERTAYLPQEARRLPAVPAGRLLTWLAGEDRSGDPGLAQHLATRADRLSAGTGRRVLLEAVLGLPSRLLVLDEPTAGLDAAAVERLTTVLADRLEAGDAIVLADHHPLLLPETVLIDLGGAVEPPALMQITLRGTGTFRGLRAQNGLLRLSVPVADSDALLSEALQAGWSVAGVQPLRAPVDPAPEPRA